MFQPPLPDGYGDLTGEQACDRIKQAKALLGHRLVILGHHYQRDEIIQFADFTGDSLKLSQVAAAQKDAEFIVFCGVHFMAESADILTSEKQKVLLPHLTAGCPMADMADIEQVERCWESLRQRVADPDKLAPVTYVNSSADIKAFCGRHGGLCCTSSNAGAVFKALWRDDPERVILFLPDQHLGRNTGYAMGVSLEAMPLWDPFGPNGSVSDEQCRRARVVLWDGFCSVHQQFTVEQVRQVRAEQKDVRVIVHPECPFEVAQAADYVGSTEYIIQTVSGAPAGSHWAVGTEIHLVERLAREMAQRDVLVRCLGEGPCLCVTMFRIDLNHLAWVLDQVVEHAEDPNYTDWPNRVVVEGAIRQEARLALDRMLAVTYPAFPR